ncbi:hypothetical protein MKX03_004367 [Papaver bracteatum]|nr:hypothetical protein MKX03_004367 [Papaver bracteatum]
MEAVYFNEEGGGPEPEDSIFAQQPFELMKKYYTKRTRMRLDQEQEKGHGNRQDYPAPDKEMRHEASELMPKPATANRNSLLFPCTNKNDSYPFDYNYGGSGGFEHIRVGCLYELNHSLQLPDQNSIPAQLKSVRVVMVISRTEVNATLRFPSVVSLHTHYSNTNAIVSDDRNKRIQYQHPQLMKKGKLRVHPELDEEYVMNLKLAGKLLIRKILSSEFSKQKHLKSFWALTSQQPKLASTPVQDHSGSDDYSASDDDDDGNCNEAQVGRIGSRYDSKKRKRGTCWSVLTKNSDLHWGVRRRVAFMGPNKRNSNNDHHQDYRAEINRFMRKSSRASEHQHYQHHSSLGIFEAVPEEEEEEQEQDEEEANANEVVEIMGMDQDQSIFRTNITTEEDDDDEEYHLSLERRRSLRSRNVDRSSNQLVVLLRRHNAEGEMEYWLEDADLVNIRREAFPRSSLLKRNVEEIMYTHKQQQKKMNGDSSELVIVPVNNPSSIDIPLGEADDSTQHQSVVPQLQGSISPITTITTTPLVVDQPHQPRQNQLQNFHTLEEDYNNLLKKKAQLEQQLLEISNSLNGMQEEVWKFTSRVEDARTPTTIAGAEKSLSVLTVVEDSNARKRKAADENGLDDQVWVTPERSDDREKVNEETQKVVEKETKEEKRQRLRSGFRICKPQGSILWPNMVAAASSPGNNNSNSSSSCSNRMMMLSLTATYNQSHVVPTPTSLSSSTTSKSDFLLLPPPQIQENHLTTPPPQVKPLLDVSSPVKKVMVTTIPSTSFSLPNNDKVDFVNLGSPPAYHHHHQSSSSLLWRDQSPMYHHQVGFNDVSPAANYQGLFCGTPTNSFYTNGSNTARAAQAVRQQQPRTLSLLPNVSCGRGNDQHQEKDAVRIAQEAASTPVQDHHQDYRAKISNMRKRTRVSEHQCYQHQPQSRRGLYNWKKEEEDSDDEQNKLNRRATRSSAAASGLKIKIKKNNTTKKKKRRIEKTEVTEQSNKHNQIVIHNKRQLVPRWSKERYRKAEVSMGIMKEKDAVCGKPVMRIVLSEN